MKFWESNPYNAAIYIYIYVCVSVCVCVFDHGESYMCSSLRSINAKSIIESVYHENDGVEIK